MEFLKNPLQILTLELKVQQANIYDFRIIET